MAELRPDDLPTAASACRTALAPALDRDWEVPAREMEWSCRRTLDHIADTLLLYSAHFATRATARRTPPRNGDPAASPAEFLTAVESAATILAEVVRAAPVETRAFHPSGMADATEFIAMGCEEALAHTWDIAEGLGMPFAAPADLRRGSWPASFPGHRRRFRPGMPSCGQPGGSRYPGTTGSIPIGLGTRCR